MSKVNKKAKKTKILKKSPQDGISAKPVNEGVLYYKEFLAGSISTKLKEWIDKYKKSKKKQLDQGKLVKELRISSFQNELGAGDIQVTTLYKVAKYFGKEASELVPRVRCSHSKRSDALSASHESALCKYYPLASGYLHKILEPFYGIVTPNKEIHDLVYHCHLNDEFIFVLDGEVEIKFLPQFQQPPILLKAWQGILLSNLYSWIPHCITSKTKSKVLKVCHNIQGLPYLSGRKKYPGKAVENTRSKFAELYDYGTITRIGSTIRALGTLHGIEEEGERQNLLELIGESKDSDKLDTWENGTVKTGFPHLLHLILLAKRIKKDLSIFLESVDISKVPRTRTIQNPSNNTASKAINEFFEKPSGRHAERHGGHHEGDINPFFNKYGYKPWDLIEATEGGSIELIRHLHKPIGVFLCRFRTREENDMIPCKHRLEGEEFVYLLDGEIEAKVGDDTFKLQTGDSIYFDSTLPHSWRAVKSDAIALAFLWDIALYKDVIESS